MGLLGGFARINELGTHVLNSSAASPIRITFDERRAVVGDPQEIKMPGAEAQALKDAFEQVILAIEQIGVSEGDKKEARSLLLKLLRSKAGADALGEGGPIVDYEVFRKSLSEKSVPSGGQGTAEKTRPRKCMPAPSGHAAFCWENSMVTARPVLDRTLLSQS